MMVRVKTQKTIPTAVIRPNMKYQEKAIQILKYFPQPESRHEIDQCCSIPSVLRALLDTRAKGLDEDMLVLLHCYRHSRLNDPLTENNIPTVSISEHYFDCNESIERYAIKIISMITIMVWFYKRPKKVLHTKWFTKRKTINGS